MTALDCLQSRLLALVDMHVGSKNCVGKGMFTKYGASTHTRTHTQRLPVKHAAAKFSEPIIAFGRICQIAAFVVKLLQRQGC